MSIRIFIGKVLTDLLLFFLISILFKERSPEVKWKNPTKLLLEQKLVGSLSKIYKIHPKCTLKR